MLVEEELSRAVPERDTALTIGVFDGVHLGHRVLIAKLNEKAAAEGLMSGVVTFQQHPRLVFSPQSRITCLTGLQERIRLLESLGAAHIVTLSFTPELSQLSAREFTLLLKRYLRMRGLVIGPDFALGKGREGDAQSLKALGEELDFTVEVVPPRVWQGEVVSSTAIRGALSQGDMMKVNQLLGRRFTLTGQVSKGDTRGKSLGFPTANIIPDQDQALPADGVYAARASFSERVYQAVINIGVAMVVLPTKGIPLPFISAGGTSMLLSAGAVGVLLNIAKQTDSAWQIKLQDVQAEGHRRRIGGN